MTNPISSLSTGLLVETAAASISINTPCCRLSLRARGDLSALNNALGFDLPNKIGTRVAVGSTEALCLGPDEWTIVAPQATSIIEACAKIYDTHPHSLVDISGREITLKLQGPQASELLTLGLSRDPETILVGQGRRTVFDGISVTLWRDAENSYRMDIWNSFATFLSDFLANGCRELAADMRYCK